MEFLIDLLFKTDYTDLPFVLIRIAVFIVLSVAIIWLLWTILSKKMFIKNDRLPKEYKMKLTFIWSLIFYYMIFSIYLFFFFKRNGIDSFQWGNPKFYLEISSHLICIISAIVLYLFKQYQLTNE
jgi:hypothetical protein